MRRDKNQLVSIFLVGALPHPPIGWGGALGAGDGKGQPSTDGESSPYQIISTYQHLQQLCMLLCHYPSPSLKRTGIPTVKSKHKHVLSSYRGVLWKEICVAWIDLEPWLMYAPDICSLINFKWAKGSHLHHNMTSVFILMWLY